MEQTEIKAQITPILKANGVRRAGLFGSAVHGKLRPDSDIDIAVELDRKIGLLEFVRIKQLLEDALHRPVDLVEFGAIKSALKAKILPTVELLYG